MVQVRVSYPLLGWPLQRQTPSILGQWENFQFHINTENNDFIYDYWIVIEDIFKKETTFCTSGNLYLITHEPESVNKYSQNFIDQFDKIITNRSDIKHHSIIPTQTFLPWIIGAKFDSKNKKWLPSYSKTYDELKRIKFPEKYKKLSVILSNKTFTKGHRERMNFVLSLKAILKDDLDIFGDGFKPIADKWDALYPYKYHLAFENCEQNNYWSEKITDSILAFSFPIYYGCPNIRDYFHSDSFIKIDLSEKDVAINQIVEIVNSDLYLQRRNSLENARDLILDEYQFFPGIVEILKKNDMKKNIDIQNIVKKQIVDSQKNKKPIKQKFLSLFFKMNVIKKIKNVGTKYINYIKVKWQIY